MSANGISTLTIPTGITATSFNGGGAGSYLVAVGTFNYDAYGYGFAIRKDGGAIDAYMAQDMALGVGNRNWTFVPGNGQPSFTRLMTVPSSETSNDPGESGVAIWNVSTQNSLALAGSGAGQLNSALIPNGTAFTIYSTELGGGGGADKEARQIAKLAIAQAKREGRVVADDGSITGSIDSTKPYYRARNVYDPDRLPTQYSGYTVVDNANSEGLLRARPWTAYNITPTASIVDEGGTLTVNIATLEILDGTTVYWSVSNSGDFGTALGTFVVNNNSGSFTVSPTKDLSTEGTETFNIILRRGSSSGTVVATFSNEEIFDVSLTPTITPAANSVDEGSSLSFAVTNLGPNGTYYWTINHVTTANADFSAVNGSFSLTGGGAQDNGTGSFNITTIADNTTEGAQTFTVSVRSGSISGTVIVTSGSITVNDTSLTASGDTAGLYRTTYTGYFADDPAWFATATVSSAAVNLSPIGDGDPGFEPFSVQLLGYFKPTTTETHTFFLNSDDASFMWIGATAVTGFTTANAFINNGSVHGSVEVSASIALTAGVYYPIRIQMGDQSGGDVLDLNYSTPTIAKTTTVTGKIFYSSATNGF